MENTKISCVPIVFGDAEVTVYRIYNTIEKPLPHLIDNMHTHVYYECHLIVDGSASIRLENRQVLIPSGNFVVIPPGVRHFACRSEYDKNDLVLGMTLRSIVTDQAADTGYFAAFTEALLRASCSPFALHMDLRSQVIQLFRSMETDGFRERMLQKSMAYAVIFSILDVLGGFQVSTEKRMENGISNKKSIQLDWLVNSHASLSEIATEMGYTTRHTARLIQQRYGLSLGEVWQLQRIHTAKKLLEQYPLTPMDQIAAQAGFSSVDGMRRAFLKWEHTPPGEYRKNILLKKE